MKIVSIANRKGGIGRSTISCNLAVYFKQTHPTLLIDCDASQGTSSSWYAVRDAAGRTDNLTLAAATDHDELLAHIEKHAPRHGYAVIDSPPRLHDMVQSAMLVSDLCVVPLAPSMPEVWATQDSIEILNEAKETRPDIDARLLLNRYRGYTQDAQELEAAIKKQLPLPLMRSRLGYRVAYTQSLAKGLSVGEWRDRRAREEMLALAVEVLNIVRRKK